MRFADVAPGTAAVFRCIYALPALAFLARREKRIYGARDPRARRFALLAGVLFAGDLIFWHHAIEAVGAGLATVLANTQVVAVALVAWLVLGERPSRGVLAAIPIVLVGIVLLSGVVGEDAFGEDPLAGAILGLVTGLAYAGFLLTLRRGGADIRRPAGPLFEATAAAAIVALIVTSVTGASGLVPSWPEHGWLLLLALTSQVLGWMLISVSLPRLPAAVTSLLMTIQPVGSVFLGMVLLDEEPSEIQFVGVALIVLGVVVSTWRNDGDRRATGARDPLSSPTSVPTSSPSS